MTTTAAAIAGAAIASSETPTDPVNSAAAMPPPATIASVHFKKGLISTIEEAVRTVPASAATGAASQSSALSNSGTRYAPISNSEAAANAISAGDDPIQ